MATLSELQARKEALEKARASGARSVSHGDKRTDFRSDAEMAAALAALDRQIAAAQGTKRTRQVRFYTNRGV